MGDDGKNFARYLRNNMTKPEVLLWVRLQGNQIGYDINRQFRIGAYVVDFYCRKYRVAIEIDGQVHDLKKGKDEVRDYFLMNQGVHVLRFSARLVLRSPDSVAEQIKEYLDRISNESTD